MARSDRNTRSSGPVRQRSRLPSDREARRAINDNIFSVRRLVDPDSQDDLLETMDMLRIDGHIPDGILTKKPPLGCTILEQHKVRRSLMAGTAGGYALGSAIADLHHGTETTRARLVRPSVKDVGLMDRRDNSIVLHLNDEEGLLAKEHGTIVDHLARLGLRHLDGRRLFRPHIRIGEVKDASLTEKLDVERVLADVFKDQVITLMQLGFDPDPSSQPSKEG